MKTLLSKQPIVGVGVMVLKDGKVLLGKRKGSHAPSEYAGPGGHLEYMESPIDCATREVEEETGIRIKNVRFLMLHNLTKYEPKHIVLINFIADWESGEPHVRELDRHEGWDWYDLDKLPAPLYETVSECVEAYKTGQTYWES